jgi:spindle assembly abnormal protein 6
MCRLSVQLRLSEASGGSAIISWIQTNAVQINSRLSLHCRHHTDSSIKQFLLARMKHWQKTSERQANTLERAASDMSALKNAYETATAEATRLRIELEGREAKLKLAHAKEVSELRERAAAAAAEMEGLKSKEISESAVKTEAIIADLRTRLEALQASYAALQSDKSAVDMRLREVQNSLTSACSEATGFNSENSKFRAALSESEDVRIAQAKELTSALTRVAVLEQSLADRNDVLTRTNDLLKAGEEAKRNSEESAALYKGQCAKLQQKLETCSSEIERGNGIITKLQEEYKSVRTKAKAKSESVRALEATLADRTSTIDTLQREISAIRSDLERERAGRESSEGIISSLKSQISEARDALANNQQVIAWLNKELNEAHSHQAHMSRPMPASLSSSFVTPPSLLSSPLSSPPPSNLPRYKASSTVGSTAPTPAATPQQAPVAAPVPAPTSSAPVRTPAKPLASSHTLLAKDSNPYLQPLMSSVAGGSPGLLTVPQQPVKTFSPAFSYEGYSNTAPHVHAAL